MKPINVIAPTLPAIYIGPPVYHQHFADPSWQAGPIVGEPAALPSTQDAVGSVSWINDVKPIPLFQYSHSIDYPPAVEQSLSANLPNRVAAPAIDEHLHDISNHLDDTRYSSSENKISIATNATSDQNIRIRKLPENNTLLESSLIDYLIPPSVASADDWTQPNDADVWSERAKPSNESVYFAGGKIEPPKSEKRKKQIQIVIPYTIKGNKYKMATAHKENAADTSTSTTVLPIVRYLRENATSKKKQTPHEITDWHKLRNAIDTWTVERFSNHKYDSNHRFDFATSTSTPPPTPSVKQIVIDFSRYEETSKPWKRDEIENRAGMGRKSELARKLQSISSTTTSTTAKERVYIVTPIPLSHFNFSSNDIDAGNWLG